MEILLMQEGHPLWEKTIRFAENCSWKAGPFLARAMRSGRFQAWERVIVAADRESIVGFCTFTERDALPEEQDFSPFIGFVFVDESRRGNRISARMIERAVRYAGELGFQSVFLSSGEQGLYEKFGFEKIGDITTIHGTTEQLFARKTKA